mmetsp:Transcript_11790/g.22427  ORF Transcript_11790/g.22427 Transcript_11790/m.22427 type:complete len:120 (-) Transcript_11790:18-377(-)
MQSAAAAAAGGPDAAETGKSHAAAGAHVPAASQPAGHTEGANLLVLHYISRCQSTGVKPNSVLVHQLTHSKGNERLWDFGGMYLGFRGVVPALELAALNPYLLELVLAGTGLRNSVSTH